jgi:CRISPR-associated protein Csb2
MPTFRLTFRPLGDSFHGRGDGGEPEWPPSPLRAFQALVCAAAGRFRPGPFESYAGPALRWLEGLPPPEVLAPPGRTATRPYRLYVPNNAGDLMVAAWARGDGRADLSGHRTEKDVRPTRFADDRPICFDWPLTADQHAAAAGHVETLRAAARGVTHLGWGVDQAVADAGLLPAGPPPDPAAERWVPAGDAVTLRVPVAGTLDNLVAKHAAFLGRLGPAGFNPVPPLTAFRVEGYRNAAEPAGRPWVAFWLNNPDFDQGGRVSFDPARRTRDVAGWVRHAAAAVCRGWPAELGDPERFACGHEPDGGRARTDDRFQYLPLPTVNPKLDRVESIRRVLVAAPPGCDGQIDWLRRRLPGHPLERLPAEVTRAEDRVTAILDRLPADDWVLGRYTKQSATWSTVTPVLLPGFDDHQRSKAEGLVWKAFRDAGLSKEALTGATAEWRAVGYRAGVGPAGRYLPADETRHYPRYHVRVRFARPVAGPLAVGAGRYRGLGLFVAG